MDNTGIFIENSGVSLFSLMLEFNLYPVKYVHLSWLKQDEHFKLLNKLKVDEASHEDISEYLLKRFKLNKQFDFDFDAPEKRVVLASSEEITRLAFYLGIILNESVIRSAVKRKERLALESCLGEEAYRFAVKKAQFLSRGGNHSAPSLLIDWNQLDRFKEFLLRTGFQVMAGAFSGTPAAFRKRLSLKMPRQWQKTLIKPDDAPLKKQACVRLLVKTHREVNREWRHLLS